MDSSLVKRAQRCRRAFRTHEVRMRLRTFEPRSNDAPIARRSRAEKDARWRQVGCQGRSGAPGFCAQRHTLRALALRLSSAKENESRRAVMNRPGGTLAPENLAPRDDALHRGPGRH